MQDKKTDEVAWPQQLNDLPSFLRDELANCHECLTIIMQSAVHIDDACVYVRKKININQERNNENKFCRCQE